MKFSFIMHIYPFAFKILLIYLYYMYITIYHECIFYIIFMLLYFIFVYSLGVK